MISPRVWQQNHPAKWINKEFRCVSVVQRPMLLFTEEKGFHKSRKVTALRLDREERGVTSGPLNLHYTQSLVGQVTDEPESIYGKNA